MANANYLPVLLVSVTNTVPDDSFVTTQPRAQVDYLSHDWQEEDVWKSWRNMTRQKNEIANGVRLENASWRTWWKQRNKLKTVTPETLNWLKDSDVTWLYGPLHTATDEKPSLKGPSVSECRSMSSTVDQKQPHKPILKHRSISQLLTSDLPTSPVFSPPESECDEAEEREAHSPLPDPTEHLSPSQIPSFPKRPTLQHTKSDTHIIRWGPNRAFRKDSPPRIEPPGQHEANSYFPRVSAGGPVQASLSQDSNSSTSQNGERTNKKKHITFNTFVEQYIAIEKPKNSSSFYGEFERSSEYDDGYEEDQEDSPEDEAELDANWGGQRIRDGGASDSDSPFEEEEDGIIEMRTSYRDTPKKQGPRSQSKVSNASSSSTASSTTNSTTNSSSPSRNSSSRKPPSRRASTTSTYRPRPPLIRTAPSHVTIAPIAPTVLKTTGAWEEGFGDDGAGSDDGFGWRERMWVYDGKKSRGAKRPEEDSQSSDGTPVELVYVPPFNSQYSYEYDIEEYDDGPLGFGDEEGYDDEDMEEVFPSGIAETPKANQDTTLSDVYHHRGSVIGSVGFEDYSGSPDHHSAIPIPIPSNHPPDDEPTVESHENLEYLSQSRLDVPKVVVEMGNTHREEDNFDVFSGPDLGEDYMHVGSSRSRPSYKSRSRASDERPSRSVSRTPSSRSRSKSRTPSPNVTEVVPSENPSLASSTSTLRPSRPGMRRAPSTVSPTQEHQPTYPSVPRGRSQSHQDLLQASRSNSSSQSSSRGRSSVRTPSSSTWDSSASPLGSLSPEASVSPGRVAVNAYVGSGRLRGDKDGRRGREEGRDRGRGRSQTTDKRLSVSLSNSPEPPRRFSDDNASPAVSRSSSGQGPPTEASFDSTTTGSSVSSTKTVVPLDKEQEARDQEVEYMRLAEEELRRRSTPTPSNSPIIEMRRAIPDRSHTVTPPAGPVSQPSSATPTRNLPPSAASPTPTKTRPPPLVPSPPLTVPPSTNSYTAISSPSPTSPRHVSPHVTTTAAPPITSEEGRPSLHRSQSSDSSIMGKAAEMVSTAGVFLGLWN